MKIRARLTLRNYAMIQAREKAGWTQAKLADEAGLPLGAVTSLESLDFTRVGAPLEAEKIATALGIEPNDVMPPEAVGERIESKREAVEEVRVLELSARSLRSRLLLQSPIRVAENKEYMAAVLSAVRRAISQLPEGLQRVLVLRGWTGEKPRSLEDVGRELGITKETVRQRQNAAMQTVRTQLQSEGIDYVPNEDYL